MLLILATQMTSRKIRLESGHNYSGSHIVSFRASFFKDGYIDVEKCAPGVSGSNVCNLRRLHSVHPSNSSCRRLIALITGTGTVSDYFMYCILVEFFARREVLKILPPALIGKKFIMFIIVLW